MKENFVRLTPKNFPPTLLEISDPPKELWLAGKLPKDQAVWLAVVGSRKFSTYGREVCEKLIAGLAGYPIVIVSGLALGIDTIAHQSALRAGLNTIAIPGSGLSRKVLYPPANHRLADEILSKGGALLSELPPETHATVYSFPQRNRIMAGLTQATLVIEATEKSGTLITARLAMEYNRDVLIVPGSIFSPNSRGTNKLISQGARPIIDSNDLLEALGFKPTESNQTKLDLSELSSPERKIVELLSISPLPRDELTTQAGLKASEANTIIMMMSLKGLIVEKMGEIRLV